MGSRSDVSGELTPILKQDSSKDSKGLSGGLDRLLNSQRCRNQGPGYKEGIELVNPPELTLSVYQGGAVLDGSGVAVRVKAR